MRSERLELVAPERFDLVEPAPKLGKALPAQSNHPHPRVAVEHVLLDEARMAQHSQVAAGGRTAHRERICELARLERSLAQELDDRTPCRIRQGG
jgi:hypothetical protein